MKLRGKRIVLGISGGIAAYKAAEVLRLCMQEGAEVKVVMTTSATRFITPLTFKALSGHPVLTALYQEDLGSSGGDPDESGVEHIDLVKNADLIVVAPATANTLAKGSWGLADDALSTVLCAAGSNILWAPAMNHRMWKNPITQDNVSRLRRLGHEVLEPDEGWMACREMGVGRLPDPEVIVERIVEMIGHPQDLEDVHVLVTAGRTEEPIDPVRFITNRSSGKMGVAVAREALARGATVTLLAGPMDVEPPDGALVERVTTAREMAERAEDLFAEADVLVMAAAVGDYRAASERATKMKRGEGMTLELEANPDILAGLVKGRRAGQVVVGFALETENPEANGQSKLERKGVDLLVVNNPRDPGAAIGGDTNVVTFMEPGKKSRRLPVLPKSEVAARILDWVVTRREAKPRKERREGSTPRASGD